MKEELELIKPETKTVSNDDLSVGKKQFYKNYFFKCQKFYLKKYILKIRKKHEIKKQGNKFN